AISAMLECRQVRGLRETGRKLAMQIGLYGLGRMGANMARRLIQAGHKCVGYNRHPEPGQGLAREGGVGPSSRAGFGAEVTPPRAGAVWLILPAAVLDQTLATITPLLAPGNAIVDGGNSFYHDDIRRARELGEKGIHYVNVGTSGGVWGLERSYCLMIGGED